jgi:hypothetical protein
MAQAPVCSEQKIRDAAQKPSGKYSDDSFWGSGAYDKPMVGKVEQEPESWKTKSPERTEPAPIIPSESFQTAYLRVWKSVDGECKVAAFMIRPIESTFEEN